MTPLRYFATFDGDTPTAFYHEGAHGTREREVTRTILPKTIHDFPRVEVIGTEPNPDCKIPPEAVEITDEQWAAFVGVTQ